MFLTSFLHALLAQKCFGSTEPPTLSVHNPSFERDGQNALYPNLCCSYSSALPAGECCLTPQASRTKVLFSCLLAFHLICSSVRCHACSSSVTLGTGWLRGRLCKGESSSQSSSLAVSHSVRLLCCHICSNTNCFQLVVHQLCLLQVSFSIAGAVRTATHCCLLLEFATPLSVL